LTLEKNRKAELSEAQAELRRLLEQENGLNLAFEKNSVSLERALSQKRGVAEALERHDAYFRYLRDEKDALKKKILLAEKKRDKCMELVIESMKEVKIYEKLKDEQYRRYLLEVSMEEAKDINDLVSFRETAGGSN
jgi:flagellar FliJ protein